MASIPSSSISSSFIRSTFYTTNDKQLFSIHNLQAARTTPIKRSSFRIQAAKRPVGVELPKVEPKFQPPVIGFTRVAEIWNSRACMIGLIGTFIVELILNKGILQLIGVEIGKGLDIPL
ncbi:light-harvesting complex-like protein OHP1, chloroplastic [Impatiens glandulifera]|uniref:light-harvesting complex-like protein OHP1, chloroplastic n=1 Tax=Impatiens glandulifera TaxID=253017 RepID=UPI001FB1847D|nr:light-harvesting complex-like protein OHP1, chloroplastic [Impatiens glandulifera]